MRRTWWTQAPETVGSGGGGCSVRDHDDDHAPRKSLTEPLLKILYLCTVYIAISPSATTGGSHMLDHMTFRVTDIAQAKAFYSAALEGANACLEVVHSTWTGYRFNLEQNTADNSSAG